MVKMQRFWVLKQLVCAVAILTAVRSRLMSSPAFLLALRSQLS
jgi:hypothetical protein